MKNIQHYINESEELNILYKNILASFSYINLLNESEGLFDECENLAEYLTELFVKNLKEKKFKISDFKIYGSCNTITKSEYKNLFTNKIRCDFYISDKYKKVHGVTNSENNKPIVIGLFIPNDEIDLIDIKVTLMHELTHYYGANILYDKDNSKNYFATTSWLPYNLNYTYNKDKNAKRYDAGYLLYELQKNELNAFSSMMKIEIDKISETDPNKVFLKLRENGLFNSLFKIYLFFKENEKYDKKKLENSDYSEILNVYREYSGKDKDSDYQLYSDLKSKILKSYKKFSMVVGKLCSKYATKKNLKYINDKIKTKDYIGEAIWDYFNKDSFIEPIYETLF